MVYVRDTEKEIGRDEGVGKRDRDILSISHWNVVPRQPAHPGFTMATASHSHMPEPGFPQATSSGLGMILSHAQGNQFQNWNSGLGSSRSPSPSLELLSQTELPQLRGWLLPSPHAVGPDPLKLLTLSDWFLF